MLGKRTLLMTSSVGPSNLRGHFFDNGACGLEEHYANKLA